MLPDLLRDPMHLFPGPRIGRTRRSGRAPSSGRSCDDECSKAPQAQAYQASPPWAGCSAWNMLVDEIECVLLNAES